MKDGADYEGVNDIDTTVMAPNVPNEEYTLGGIPALQDKLRALIQQYSDIFSYSVKGKAYDVPHGAHNRPRKVGDKPK